MNALVKALPISIKVSLVVSLLKWATKLTPTKHDDEFIEAVEAGLKKAGIDL